MCGRYRLSKRAEVLAACDAQYEGVDWDARYNIAPTQNIPVIVQDAKAPIRRASLMRWGLVPRWAKDPAIGARMINARAETAAEKSAFKESLGRRRCLIPADGFYEWKRSGRSKQPYCFELVGREPFACTILTTTPNQLLADVHNRMPAILSSENYDLWLDPGFRDVAAATEVLTPFDAGLMRRYPVGERVNIVTNDDPGCSEPIEPLPPAQVAMF
jgi:putative SOS response-associated peptidase YedK